MFLGWGVFGFVCVLELCIFGAVWFWGCVFLGLCVCFWGCVHFGAVCVWFWGTLPVFGAECFGAECVFGGCLCPTHPWAPRLQPECQEEEEGGGRMRWLSSCICRRMGRRSPHEMFSSPSTISSPSSCSTDRDQNPREKLGMWGGDWGL